MPPTLPRTLPRTLSVPFLLLAALCASAQAQSGRDADPALNQQIQVDLKSCEKPVWPQESLRREETGKVTLAFLVGLDGAVLESKVVTSSGHPLLDHAARDGIERCKFTPPAQVGRSQPQWVKMQYVWTLQGSGKPSAEERAALLAQAARGDARAQYQAAGLYLGRDGGDAAQGIELLRQSAGQGDPKAQMTLGTLLMLGRHAPRDLVASETWLRRAAEQGGSDAQYVLGEFLLRYGTDAAEGRDWLRKSAAQGNADGQAALAQTLLQNEADLPQAVELLQQAAQKQNRQAQFLLGRLYLEGHGVEEGRDKAMRLLEQAAAAGHPRAAEELARLAQKP